MNYRHAYHAGNFADVLKHATLALAIERLKSKPAAFRVIDTHAGTGLYDLNSEAAQKTGEWRSGIGRLLGRDAAPLPDPVATLLAPWLDIVRQANPDGGLNWYPGSPLVARKLMRPDDVLVVNELHPQDAEILKRELTGMPATRFLTLDGWTALKSLLPPKERRGLTLVDPPYEQPGELARLVSAAAEAQRRFATGTLILWYPIKALTAVRDMHEQVGALGLPKTLVVEMLIRRPDDATRLNGSGMLILNPPYTLAENLAAMLPTLTDRLAQGTGASFRLEQGGENT